MSQEITLIATLGGQPQVVTYALDQLKKRKFIVTELRILHLEANTPRLKRSLERLKAALGAPRYQDMQRQPIFLPIRERRSRQQLDDIRNDRDANITWQMINQMMAKLKNDGRMVHVCLTGGRRMLALQTMSAAMLYFGHEDALWHMFTPETLLAEARDGELMHPPADAGVQLIKVPMMPWGSYFPILREMAQPVSDDDVLARQRGMLDSAERRRCEIVISRLTRRQRDVLRELANGLHPDEVSNTLAISRKTVDSHKTVILDHCRNVWDVPDEQWLDYHFIANKFGTFPTGS